LVLLGSDAVRPRDALAKTLEAPKPVAKPRQAPQGLGPRGRGIV